MSESSSKLGLAIGVILLVEPGKKTSDEMFTAAVSSNNMLSWILRAVGGLLSIVGLFVVKAKS